MSFQTNRNPIIRITPLSSTLLSVRQQFQNGLSHTSCFSSLCVHRCRPLSHSTMRSKSFWNWIYIFLFLVWMFFLWFWFNTSNKKRKYCENIYVTSKRFWHSLCCYQIGISTTWKRRCQSFRHDIFFFFYIFRSTELII